MAALLTCLIGAALATLGGRWWSLATAAQRLGMHGARTITLFSATTAAGIAAISGAWIGAQVRGPGMLLFLALALLFAGIGALWSLRAAPADAGAATRGPLAALILQLAALLSDGAPFLILAVAAWSREPVWSALGGAAGMVAAVLLGASLPAAPRALRIAVAVALVIVGAGLAVDALALV